MASKMLDEFIGKHVKLTKTKILLKISDNSYAIWCSSDNKKVLLSTDDIIQLRLSILENSQVVLEQSLPIAILEKHVIKHCIEQDYYAIVAKSNYGFIMGLKKDTIKKIVELYDLL
jgi:hypothetical protein